MDLHLHGLIGQCTYICQQSGYYQMEDMRLRSSQVFFLSRCANFILLCILNKQFIGHNGLFIPLSNLFRIDERASKQFWRKVTDRQGKRQMRMDKNQANRSHNCIRLISIGNQAKKKRTYFYSKLMLSQHHSLITKQLLKPCISLMKRSCLFQWKYVTLLWRVKSDYMRDTCSSQKNFA